MWNHPQTKENIARLKTQGVTIIEPTEGMLACGDKGKGKLENVDVIFEEIQRQLSASTKLQGKKVIVTAGGTTEPIDSVRVITNNSSGKMGSAIAEELYLQGADVLLLKSKQAVSPRYPIAEKTFVTSNDLHNLLKQFVPNYQTIFHAAAVSDFSIQSRKDKLPSDKIQTLTLLPQRKIVEEIKILNPKMQLFAFKAVYGKNSLKKKAKEKLLSSHADAVIANDISEGRGFEKDENAVLVVTRTKSKEFSLKPKKQLAKEIIDFLL